VVESESEEGRRFIKKMHQCPWDPPFWAGDQATASICRVEFFDLAQGEDGEWHPKPKAAPSRAARKDDWREKNASRLKAKRRAYYDKDPDRAKKLKTEWRLKNPERHKQSTQEYCKKNRERQRQRMAEWRAKNPDRARANGRVWSARNKDKLRAKSALWRWKVKKQSNGILGRHVPEKLWEARKAVFGHRCAYCGVAESATLELQKDHVKPIARGGPHILANLRPACPGCNSKKKNMDHKIWLHTISTSEVSPWR
jgi:5-methylcytosine-specific restriction endonuclease McrA